MGFEIVRIGFVSSFLAISNRGMVDKAIVMNDFNDVLSPDMQAEMRKRNVIYIPNRSFTSYSCLLYTSDAADE